MVKVQTHGTDLSFVCTRESLTSTVHLMLSSRLHRSQLNPVSKLRLPLQMLDYQKNVLLMHSCFICNLTSWLEMCCCWKFWSLIMVGDRLDYLLFYGWIPPWEMFAKVVLESFISSILSFCRTMVPQFILSNNGTTIYIP
jgi:hypothetical protein